MNRSLETLLQKRVDGLLLMCTENHRPSKDAISRYPSLPIVMMDWSPFDGANDVIQDNALLGGEMATEYLIRQGYRKIACITGPLDKTTAQERLNGYRQAMNKAGLAILPGYEVSGDFEFEGGVPAMEKLLALPNRLMQCLPEMMPWPSAPIRLSTSADYVCLTMWLSSATMISSWRNI